jgi:hypothetical protein
MIRYSRILFLIAFAIVLHPYAASLSDTGGTITVRNGTRHYIHAYVGPTAYLYIRPGGAVSFTSPEGSALARVFYAPAQGIVGGADSVLTITAVYNEGFDCAGGGNGCGSSTESEGGLSYTSATWNVTPEVLGGGAR